MVLAQATGLAGGLDVKILQVREPSEGRFLRFGSDDDGVRLAPAYDFVPQAHLTIDGRMALAVNGRYRLAELTREDLAAELGGWGLRAAADLVDETLEEAAVAIGRETPVAGAFTGLQESLAVATDRLRSARSPAARRSKSQAGSIWTK